MTDLPVLRQDGLDNKDATQPVITETSHGCVFFLNCLCIVGTMSHFTSVKTEYTDPEMIVEAIQKAFPFITEIEVAKDFEFEGSTVVSRGWQGQTATHQNGNPYKIVARAPNRYDLGFAMNRDGTFEIVSDWGGGSYGFLANQDVKASIAEDRALTEDFLREQDTEDYTTEQIDELMRNYPSRQQAVMGMLSRGYAMAIAEDCVRLDPNLAGYNVNEIKVSIGKDEKTGKLEVEHQIELSQSTIVGSYI